MVEEKTTVLNFDNKNGFSMLEDLLHLERYNINKVRVSTSLGSVIT